MTDIYDIKDVLLASPINLVNSIIYILFVVGLILLYKFLNKKNEEAPIEKKVRKKVLAKKDFKKILDFLEKKYIDKPSEIFYSKLLEILREILKEKGFSNISSMTLEQINNLDIDRDLRELISSIYYKEYMQRPKDGAKLRLTYIDKIRGLIK